MQHNIQVNYMHSLNEMAERYNNNKNLSTVLPLPDNKTYIDMLQKMTNQEYEDKTYRSVLALELTFDNRGDKAWVMGNFIWLCETFTPVYNVEGQMTNNIVHVAYDKDYIKAVIIPVKDGKLNISALVGDKTKVIELYRRFWTAMDMTDCDRWQVINEFINKKL